ncbi:MAG: ATP-binding cassette domain-containing protein [Actinophytocola sp.]|nr:ATP-binding cassette domain-containing protein [Actinophytocola sp.]
MTLPLADGRMVRRWLRDVARRRRGDFAAMLTLFVLASLLGLVGPRLLGVLVDAVAAGTRPPIDLLAGIFFAVLLAQAALRRWGHVRATRFGEHLLATARADFTEHVLRLPIGTVEDAGTGDLLSRATADVDRIEYAARYAAPEILTSSIAVVLTVAAMLVTSPLLTAGVLVSVPLLVLTTRWYWRRANPVLERMLAAWGDVQASATETVTGARTVEALGLADRRVAHNDRALRAAVAAEHAHRSLLARWLPTLDLAYLLPIAAVLAIGGLAYRAGLAGLGDITAVALYLLAMSGPLVELLAWVEELQVGSVGLRRILGVRRVPPARDGARVTPSGRDIRLRDVRFAYRDGHDVLHGIDLDVAAGERLMIIGPSGSGKSTLARLLAGLAEPGSGTVSLGGVDLRRWPHDQLRGEVLLLTQEHHVFAATVRENLMAGEVPRRASYWRQTTARCPSWHDAHLRDVLAVVGADDWVRSLPDGLDTRLGAGALAVPPAVAQQLALARVLLANPPVVVLDEATAAMDNGAARQAERAVAVALAGRTVISIAHRLDAARDADRILVLDGGRVAAFGTHDELLADGGSYARVLAAAPNDTTVR